MVVTRVFFFFGASESASGCIVLWKPQREYQRQLRLRSNVAFHRERVNVSLLFHFPHELIFVSGQQRFVWRLLAVSC